MGLRRGSAAEFFQPASGHAALSAERQRWLTSEPQTYSALLPPGAALLEECLQLALDWQTISSEQSKQVTALASPSEGCRRLGEI